MAMRSAQPRLPGPRRGIQSVEVAGRILSSLLEMQRPVRLTDLAHKAALPRAKLHRYLISLGRAGLIGQHDASGRYDLGGLARRISSELHASRSAADVALPFARELSRQLKETVFITEMTADGPVSVHSAVPDLPVVTTPRLGLSHPLRTTATGRVFAAFLPDGVRDALLERELRGLAPGSRKPRLREFDKVLAEVRHRGLSASHEERVPGINALSAPVLDSGGRILLALTVVGNAASFAASPDSACARQLKDAAARVASELAGPPYREQDKGSRT